MPVQLLPRVQEEFAMYLAWVAQGKIVQSHPVELTREAQNVEYVGKSSVEMGWAEFPCRFEAAKSPRVRMKYELKLFAEYFGEKPCFRFCTRSGAHMNPETGDGLPARNVPTPHFHRVNSDGILVAYQTPPLVNPVERAEIIADPQLGTNLFCQEANLFSPSGGSVVVKILPTELDLSTDDPLGSATFPQP